MSFLAYRFARQVCLRTTTRYRITPAVVARRSLHVSAAVSAKKKNDDDDLFAEQDESDGDLFADAGDAGDAVDSRVPSASGSTGDENADMIGNRKRKRFLPSRLKESTKSTLPFRKQLAFLKKTMSTDSTAMERENINVTHVRKLIQAARTDTDWVQTRDTVDQWQNLNRASEKTMEFMLRINWWILRRMAPRAEVIDPYADEDDTEAAAKKEPKDPYEMRLPNVPRKDPELIASRLEYSLIENSGQLEGRQRILFNSIYDQLMSRIPTKDPLRAPIANLQRLIQLAEHRPDLDKVAEVLKRWREFRGKPDQLTSSSLIKRCLKLKEPIFLVQMLADRVSYGIDLDGLKQVHMLFKYLLQGTTLKPEESVTAAFQLAEVASGMPWRHIMQDPVSAPLLIAICHRASKSTYAQTSMELGAQVLDELQAYVEMQKSEKERKEKKGERDIALYRRLGFVTRPKGMELSEQEKVWRQKSVEAARKFGEDLGLDVSWLVIPSKGFQPQVEEVRA